MKVLIIWAGTVGICWWRRFLWLMSTSLWCFLGFCPCMWCHFSPLGTSAMPPESTGTGGSWLSRWKPHKRKKYLSLKLWTTDQILTIRWNHLLIPLSGLSVGRPVHQKRLVPSLHSSRKRVWSVEEPLRLLYLHPGLAHSPGGGRAVWDPQPTKHRGCRGGGREEEGEEDQADDQRQTSGGEEWVEKMNQMKWGSGFNSSFMPVKTFVSLQLPVLPSVIFAGLSMRTRRPWGSYAKPEEVRRGSTQTGRTSARLMLSSLPPLSWSSSLCLSLDKRQSVSATECVEKVQASSSFRWLSTNEDITCW